MREKGYLIVIEGIDASGKTTLCKNLEKELKKKNFNVFLTSEPTDFETGKLIRKILSEKEYIDIHSLSALFLADRIVHLNHPEFGIKKHLEEKYIVICDRFYYSSFAYQGLFYDAWVTNINLTCPDILRPNLCIFLDTPPEVCYERITKERKNIEIYERDIETLIKTRKKYFTYFDEASQVENIIVISSKDLNEKKITEYAEKEILNFARY